MIIFSGSETCLGRGRLFGFGALTFDRRLRVDGAAALAILLLLLVLLRLLLLAGVARHATHTARGGSAKWSPARAPGEAETGKAHTT
jgi:hypothetical protein